MDRLCIGNMVKVAVTCAIQSSRRSGKTTELVNSLKTGDMVVFTNKHEAIRVERLAAERGIEIKVIVVPADKPSLLFDQVQPKGNLVFDHSWVEDFYLLAISSAALDIDYFQFKVGRSEQTPKTKMSELEHGLLARNRDRWEIR